MCSKCKIFLHLDVCFFARCALLDVFCRYVFFLIIGESSVFSSLRMLAVGFLSTLIML